MNLLNWGILGLFIGTFLSATIIPFPSEALVLGAYAIDIPFCQVLLIASMGNFLGSCTNYLIGFKTDPNYIQKKLKIRTDKFELWSLRIQKYGLVIGLLVWLPIIGEVLTILLGFFRVSFLRLSLFMLIGIVLRYVVVLYLYSLSIQ